MGLPSQTVVSQVAVLLSTGVSFEGEIMKYELVSEAEALREEVAAKNKRIEELETGLLALADERYRQAEHIHGLEQRIAELRDMLAARGAALGLGQ